MTALFEATAKDALGVFVTPAKAADQIMLRLGCFEARTTPVGSIAYGNWDPHRVRRVLSGVPG